ncbi:hypothetical protein [Sphingobacterium faecium]
MASIITNIAFKNFYNYYGDFELNSYDFKEGVNIIVADNGNGKSKFFNALLWLFKDEVLDSDSKKSLSIKTNTIKIISDRAKSETQLNGIVDCAIRITYSDKRFSYEIIKSFTAKKIGDTITNPNDWYIYFNDLQINKRDLDLFTYHPVRDEDEKNRILNKLIQEKLRPYSLFQGEEVDKIIDFSNPKAINNAVQTLTNIQKYEKLINRTTYAFKRAEDSLNTKIKESNTDTQRFDEIIDKIEKARNDIEIESQRNDQFNTIYEEAKEEIDDLETANQNAVKRKEIDDKIKTQNTDLKIVEEDYENLTSKINNRFYDGSFGWIAHGCSNFVNIFRSKNQEYIEKRVAYKLQKLNIDDNSTISFLPTDSPDVVTLQTMIDKEFCYVCNRIAQKGTHEHNHLIKLLERPNKKSDQNIYKNDLASFFSDIQVGSQSYLNRINDILDSVKSTREKEHETKEKIKQLNIRIKDLKDKRSNLLLGGENAENDTNSIMSRYKNAISKMERAKTSLENSSTELKKIEKRLHSLEEEKSHLKVKDVPDIYQTNYGFALDLKNAAERTRDRIYNEMLKKLEENANEHFQNLIKYNELKGGQLKFSKVANDTIEFQYVDNSGNEVSGASEGFQRMKVLSVLMAIISISKTGYEYPLLADAPLSAFGQGFIKGFFEETAKVFPQSLLLIKDIYDKDTDTKLNTLGQELLKNPEIKSLYVNQIPEGLAQIEIYTEKFKLK